MIDSEAYVITKYGPKKISNIENKQSVILSTTIGFEHADIHSQWCNKNYYRVFIYSNPYHLNIYSEHFFL